MSMEEEKLHMDALRMSIHPPMTVKEEKNCSNKAGLCIPEEGLHFMECEEYKKPVEEEKDTSWEERFRRKWEGANTGGHNAISTPVMDEIIEDIRQEREALLNEQADWKKSQFNLGFEEGRKFEKSALLKEILGEVLEKRGPIETVGNSSAGYFQALFEVQELIKKKI